MTTRAFPRSNNKKGLVCILLGISPASDCCMPTFRNTLSVPSSYEDGTDRVFRNVSIQQSDAGEIPKRIHTRFKTRRKFEINKKGLTPTSPVNKPHSPKQQLDGNRTRFLAGKRQILFFLNFLNILTI